MWVICGVFVKFEGGATEPLMKCLRMVLGRNNLWQEALHSQMDLRNEWKTRHQDSNSIREPEFFFLKKKSYLSI